MGEHGAVVHLKREPFDVCIDRTTAWGNPFVIGRDGDRDEVIAKYMNWVITGVDQSARWIRANIHKLHDQTLGCWCAPPGGVTAEDLPWVCHGQFLLSMAEEHMSE